MSAEENPDDLADQFAQLSVKEDERKEKFLEGLAERLTRRSELIKALKKAEDEKLFTDDEMKFITEKLLKLDKSNLETSVAELEIPEFLAPVDDTAGHPIRKAEIEDDEKAVDVEEFVKYLFERLYRFVIKEKVELRDFTLAFYTKAAEGFPTRVLTTHPMLHKDAASAINSTKNQQVFTDFEQRPDYIRVVRLGKSGASWEDFSLPLFKSAVDIYFRKYIGDKRALREHLLSECYLIEDGDFGEEIIRDKKSTEEQLPRLPANLDYVKVEVDGGNIFSTEHLQADKRYAIVVTGESGSGKTMYSIGKVLEKKFLPIYCAIPPPSSSTTITSVKNCAVNSGGRS